MKNNMKNEKKKKKNKTVYVDDGSRIADMSSFRAPAKAGNQSRPRASFKEQFQTYINAVKLMFLPMLAVLGMLALALAFFLVYIML